MSARLIDPPTYLDAVVTATFNGVSSGTLSLPINFVSEMIYACGYVTTASRGLAIISATDSENSLYLIRISDSGVSSVFTSLVAAHNSVVPTTTITLKTNATSAWSGFAAGIIPAIGLNPYSSRDNVLITAANPATISTTVSDLILAFLYNEVSSNVIQQNYPPFNFVSVTQPFVTYKHGTGFLYSITQLVTEYTQMEPGMYVSNITNMGTSYRVSIDTIKIHKPYVDVASPLIAITSTPSSVNIGNMVTYNSSTSLILWSLTNDKTATGFLNGERISSISTSGAVWANRLFTKFSGIGDVGTTVNFGEIEEWYAPTSGSISNSITIVATSSDSGLREIYAFAAVGLNNISSPFDSAALPVSNFTQRVSSVSIGVNRNQNQDLVYGLVAVVESSSFTPAPNQISFMLTTLSQFSVNVFYTPISAALGTTGISASGLANNNPSGTIQWFLVGDALTAVPAGHTPVNASALLSSSLLWATIYNRKETRPLFSQPILTTYSVRTPQRLNISTLNTTTNKLRSPSRSIVSNPVIQTSIRFVKNLQRSLASSLSILSNVIRTPMRQLLSTLMILTVLSSVRAKVQTLMANLGFGTQALRSVQRSIISRISTLASIGRLINRVLSSLISFLTSLSAAKSGIKTLVLSAQLLLSTSLLRNIVRALFGNIIIQTTTQIVKNLQRQMASSISLLTNSLKQINRTLITNLIISSVLQSSQALRKQLISSIQTFTSLTRNLGRSVNTTLSLALSVTKQIGRFINSNLNLSSAIQIMKTLKRQLTASFNVLSGVLRGIGRPLITMLVVSSFVQLIKAKALQLTVTLQFASNAIRSLTRIMTSSINLLTSMLSSVISAGGHVLTLTVNLVFSTSRLSSLIRSLSSQITTLSSFVRQMGRPLVSLMQIGTIVQRVLSSIRQISSGLSLITSTIRSPSRLFMSIIALQSATFRILNRLLLIGISINSTMIRILSKSLLITMSFSSNVAIIIIIQQTFKFIKIKLQSLVNLIKVMLS